MSTYAQPPAKLQNPRNETLALLRQKWERLNTNNEHWMCVLVGEEGSGKSWTAMTIGELIDPTFSADNVFFHPADVLERLRDEEYDSGDVWVLDEAGVGMGKRSWQDSGQKKLNQALQLIRSHNVGFIFTLPRLGELDSQTKGRLQNAMEVVKKKDGEYIQGPWWSSEVDRMDMGSSSNDVWWSKPTINGKELGAVAIGPPSQEIVEPYEEKKEEFQEEFYDETIDELREDSDGEDDEQMDPQEVATEIIETDSVDQFVTEINGGTQQVLDADLIGMEYGLGQGGAKRAKKKVKAASNLEGVL